MEKDIWAEKIKNKKREKIKYKKNLDVNLLELILIVKNLISVSKLVKYTITLMN